MRPGCFGARDCKHDRRLAGERGFDRDMRDEAERLGRPQQLVEALELRRVGAADRDLATTLVRVGYQLAGERELVGRVVVELHARRHQGSDIPVSRALSRRRRARGRSGTPTAEAPAVRSRPWRRPTPRRYRRCPDAPTYTPW